MCKADYRIYPTLLDKYQAVLNYEETAEQPWNQKDGSYVLTPDEMLDKAESELLDTINRVPRPSSMAADRGTALNMVVDLMVAGEHPYAVHDKGAVKSYYAEVSGHDYHFEPRLCHLLSEVLRGAICQLRVSALLPTSLGLVELYGYLDYWCGDAVIDLKSTSHYTYGQYADRWQRYVYPYCCIEGGLAEEVNSFSFLVAQLGRGKVIKGEVTEEYYPYDHNDARIRLAEVCEGLIRWIEARADMITDNRIYGQ